MMVIKNECSLGLLVSSGELLFKANINIYLLKLFNGFIRLIAMYCPCYRFEMGRLYLYDN